MTRHYRVARVVLRLAQDAHALRMRGCAWGRRGRIRGDQGEKGHDPSCPCKSGV